MIQLCSQLVTASSKLSPARWALSKLTITDSGSHFSALGGVANQRDDGVGIEFTDLGPMDRARLEECLAELTETGKLTTRLTPEPPSLPSAQVPPSTNVHTSGVLVVDDHDVTRSTIHSFLRLNSVPVCGEAENGKQAVERVQRATARGGSP